ncbi:hypothetical protein WR25_21487 [Diploscapter pachys]|uniref:CAS family C-terminal domain-containing protein n=1 Tax=Diploscapter pachys TaxID=2018661 RepID=A0A2A2LXV2_9BILA|nr:hypothetical protein WR25_21487 [Diploscapter pachys]
MFQFFQVANPLFEDFFMFNHRASPFDSPFDRNFFNIPERRIFPAGFRDRFEPVRRINSCDDALNMTGQVRHIPIKVIDGKSDNMPSSLHPSHSMSSPSERRDGFPPMPEFDRRIDRRFSDFPTTPGAVRRTFSSGRVSPIGGDPSDPFFAAPSPSPALSTASVPVANGSGPATTSQTSHPLPNAAMPRRTNGFPQKIPVEVLPSPSPSNNSTAPFPTPPPFNNSSSDEDDRRSVRSAMTSMSDRPLRSLVIPSSVPGRSLEIPLGPGPSPSRGSSSLSLNGSNVRPPPQNSSMNDEVRKEQLFEPRESRESHNPSQMEKLTQRLRKMAGKPFRTLSPLSSNSEGNREADRERTANQQKQPQPQAQNSAPATAALANPGTNDKAADNAGFLSVRDKERDKEREDQSGRTPSPSSSGIVADINENSSEEKRVSDTSSLSDQNSSLSENSDEHRPQIQQQAQIARNVPITVHGRLNGNGGTERKELNGGIDRIDRLDRMGPRPMQSPVTTGSLLQDFFDKIERPDIKKFGMPIKPQSNGRGDWIIPTSIEEDMRRNASPHWNHVPTTIRNSNVGAILDEEVAARKRVICNKMGECLKMIETASEQINKITAPQQWRAAHILQGNLNGLRDAVTTIHESLDDFVDSTQRISIDRTNPKYVEISKLMAPLHESRSMIGSLRKSLDLGGWTVAVLARDSRNSAEAAHLRVPSDPLEQFINYAKTVPSDCRRIYNWALSLVPSSTILFLSPSATVPPNSLNRAPFSHPTAPAQAKDTLERADRTNDKNGTKLPPIHLLDTPIMDDGKRLSGSSTSSGEATSTSSQPSSILVNTKSRNADKPRNKVTFADESGDRTSSGSSIDNSSVEYASIRKLPTVNGSNGSNGSSAPATASAVLRNLRNGSQTNGGSLLSHPPESRIIEEDDLESNVSDRESLFQDYAYLDDVVPGRASIRQSNGIARGNGHSNGVGEIENDDEDRQLVRFYAPQLEQHTDALTLAVDEFLATVENNLPPREFVQKGKLIILAAHKLIYIGDSVSQCVQNRLRSTHLRKAADKLCSELQDCVQATKSAADEYPDIKSMQAMVDSVMGVSRSAHELKLLVRDCC